MSVRRRVASNVAGVIAIGCLTVGLGASGASGSATTLVNTDAPTIGARIIGGEVATTNPGLAAFGKESGRLSCTASLISPEWILAAKHCFISEASRPFVRVGSLQLASGGVERNAIEVKFAPNADLALMKINQPVTDIALVKLAEKAPAVGDMVTTWGWGRTSTTSETPSPDLKVAKNKVVSVMAFDGKGGSALNLSGIDGGPWKGDSGGPAFDAAMNQVGVASTANGQMPNPQSNYTNVTKYRAWIKEVSGV